MGEADERIILTDPENIMSTSSLTLHIGGMGCQSCVAKIEKIVTAIDGVQAIRFDLAEKLANITYSAPTQPEAITAAISAAGYEPSIQASTSL